MDVRFKFSRESLGQLIVPALDTHLLLHIAPDSFVAQGA